MSGLEARRVVVTRPADQSREICELLTEAGAVPVLIPTIAIVPPSSFEALDRALGACARYEWIVFTSANGARSVLERSAALGLDLAGVDGLKLAAVGPATRRILTDAGLVVSATPSHYRGSAIPDALGDLDRCRIMLPRSDLADDTLPGLLRARGALVDAVAAYRTKLRELTPADLTTLEQGVDAITFTSPSTVRGLVEGLGRAEYRGAAENRGFAAVDVLKEVVVACVGAVTSKAARALGVRVHVEASESTARGLVEALDTYEGWVRHTSPTAS